MEKEEEKKSQDQAKFEPMLDLKAAMEEHGIDPNSPDFSKEALVAKFQQLSEDMNIHFQ
jgi:hypothetical protein